MNDTYYSNGNEVQLFEQAHKQRLPVMLTGPDWLRQDAAGRTHGAVADPTRGHDQLP